MGCEGGLCAASQLSPCMRPGSAGVWDRRPLGEGGKEGFDKLYLFFSFFFFHTKLPSDDKLSNVGRQHKDWQGWL